MMLVTWLEGELSTLFNGHDSIALAHWYVGIANFSPPSYSRNTDDSFQAGRYFTCQPAAEEIGKIGEITIFDNSVYNDSRHMIWHRPLDISGVASNIKDGNSENHSFAVAYDNLVHVPHRLHVQEISLH
jgi:hypothetical protein